MFLTKESNSPYYQIVYFIDGKRTKKSTKKTTKADAEKVLIKFLFNYNGVNQKPKLNSPLLIDFIQEYLNELFHQLFHRQQMFPLETL